MQQTRSNIWFRRMFHVWCVNGASRQSLSNERAFQALPVQDAYTLVRRALRARGCQGKGRDLMAQMSSLSASTTRVEANTIHGGKDRPIPSPYCRHGEPNDPTVSPATMSIHRNNLSCFARI